MTNIFPAAEALAQARRNRASRNFPDKSEARFSRGMLFPHLDPSFRLSRGDTVFTIGSCFARNIETELDGFILPTRKIALTSDDVTARHPNGILNEFTPGSITQRILWALEGKSTAAMEVGYAGEGDQQYDLLSRKGSRMSPSRLREIRSMIDDVYADMVGADAMIVTLGMVETWYDAEHGIWLNRMPEMAELRAAPERFQFRILSAEDSVAQLEHAFAALIEKGLKRIVLTVSPVPLQTTFSGMDCVTANSYSKAAMRICAERLRQRFEGIVDYFPSYEMVLSGGAMAFRKDLIHPKDEIIARVTDYLVQNYVT